jgi:hypothetical protein
METDEYVEHQYNNMIKELIKEEQVIINKSGRYITTVGLLNLYRKGFYPDNFDVIQRSIEKILSDDTSKHKDHMRRSLALMYTEN